MMNPMNPGNPGSGQGSRNDTESGLPLELMYDLPVEITVELGRRRMTIGEFLDLGPGAVLELRKLVGDPLEIRVNQRLVARGEAVAVGEMYGVRITEVLKNRQGAGPGLGPLGPQGPLSHSSESR